MRSTLCNPLLLSIIFIIAFLKLTNISYDSYDNGAEYINYFLTPSTVLPGSAIVSPVKASERICRSYRAQHSVRNQRPCAIMIFGLSKFFALEMSIYASLVPKSITTAIALGMTEEMGGVAAVTVMSVFLTGIWEL